MLITTIENLNAKHAPARTHTQLVRIYLDRKSVIDSKLCWHIRRELSSTLEQVEEFDQKRNVLTSDVADLEDWTNPAEAENWIN